MKRFLALLAIVCGLWSPAHALTAPQKAAVINPCASTIAQAADAWTYQLGPGLQCLNRAYKGTGRVALMATGVNRIGSGAGGGSYANTNTNSRNFARRAGFPWYVLLKEATPNVWIGYDLPWSNTGGINGVNNLSPYNIYKPGVLVTVTDAGVTDGDGGAVAYPTNAAAQYVQWDLTSKSSAITRVAFLTGLGSSNSGIEIVSMTDGASNPVIPNLLPTAAQMAARSQIASSALVSNGGGIPDAAYVVGTNANDNTQGNRDNGVSVPVYDGPPVSGLKVRFTYTGVAGLGGGTVDRGYTAGVIYGTAAMSDTDAGADLWRFGYISAQADGSTNDTAVIDVRVTGSGNGFVQMGGGHGNEYQTAITTTVNSVPYVLTAPTTTRASTGALRTLCFSALGLGVGDRFDVSGTGNISYTGQGFTVSAVNGLCVDYTDTYGTSLSEVTTADTAGRYVSDAIIKGAQVKVSRTSYFVHPSYLGGTTDIEDHVMSYTLDASRLHVEGTLTPAVASLDHNNGTYLGLSSFWSANAEAACAAADFPGPSTLQSLDAPSLKANLHANDNSENWPGQHVGVLAFNPTNGVGSAFVQNSAFTHTGWNGGVGYLLVQDRSPCPVKKAYLRLTTGTYVQTTPLTYDFSRYDMIFPPGSSGRFLPR